MNPTLSPNDLDALSAYLDNQLPPAERAALEASLATDPALRAELDGLRAIQRALNSLPQLTSPRNLTLSTAQARPVKRVAVFPALVSGLSAVAAILLIVAGAGLLRPANQPLNEAPQLAVAAAPGATSSLPSPPESPAARVMETVVMLAPTVEEFSGDVAQTETSANTGAAESDAADLAFAAQPPTEQEVQEAAADSMLAGSAPAGGSGAEPAAAVPQMSPLPTLGVELGLQAQATAPAEAEATRLKEATATPASSATFSATATATPSATQTATPAPTETPLPTPAPAGQSAGPTANESSIQGLVLLGLGGLLLVAAVWAWRRAR